MRVLGLGLPCDESSAAMRAMRAANVNLVGIVVAEPTCGDAEVAAGRSRGIESFATLDDIPLVTVLGAGAALTDAIQQFRPDVIVAACFPWRLSPAVLALPPLGCLNLHPSLLPRGRGPDPVFWTYRRAERETGVTVHLMDAGFDTGPILGQQRYTVPVGGRAPALERELMAGGGGLAARLLPEHAAGRLTPIRQDDALATTAPMPTASDFIVATTMPAAAAYAFVRAVAPLNGPLAIAAGAANEHLPVADAIDYATDDPMTDALVDEGRGIVRVRFGAGWVRVVRAGAGR